MSESKPPLQFSPAGPLRIEAHGIALPNSIGLGLAATPGCCSLSQLTGIDSIQVQEAIRTRKEEVLSQIHFLLTHRIGFGNYGGAKAIQAVVLSEHVEVISALKEIGFIEFPDTYKGNTGGSKCTILILPKHAYTAPAREPITA